MGRLVEERYKINESFYEKESPNRVESMRENGVDYLIVSQFVNPDLVFDDSGLEQVFKNRDITLYALE